MKDWYLRNKYILDRFEGLFLKNTVLVQGLLIAPVVVAANTVKKALILSLMFFAVTFLTVVLARFIPRKLMYAVRVVLYTVISSLLFIPLAMLVNRFWPGVLESAGIYLPLLVTNSLIVSKIQTRFLPQRFFPMLTDLTAHLFGAVAVMLILSAVREMFGNATFFGIPLMFVTRRMPILMLPFGGFILVGLAAAAIAKINHKIEKYQQIPAAEQLESPNEPK